MGRPGGGPSAASATVTAPAVPASPAPLLLLVLLVVLAGGCRSVPDDGPTAGDPDAETRSGASDAGDPADGEGWAEGSQRAVAVSTTSCGHASPSEGFGVAISDGLVLTVAHVLAGSTEVTIARPGARAAERPATIAAYDPLRDLALLEADLSGWAIPAVPIRFGSLDAGEGGLIIGDGETGGIPFTVAEKTVIEMDEVRGTRRSQRSGYRVDARTGPGDSGSGLYASDGRLAGILFAVSTDDDRRSWATAADELEAFLADRSVRGGFACDPDRSRLESIGAG